MNLLKKKQDINIKLELKKHGYKLVRIILESEKSIKFLEYDNCCSNEYKLAILKRNSILIYNNNKKLVDKIKI